VLVNQLGYWTDGSKRLASITFKPPSKKKDIQLGQIPPTVVQVLVDQASDYTFGQMLVMLSPLFF
jgi:hypothetical protein